MDASHPQSGPAGTDASLALWLDRPVPRYTSYPPAPLFHDGVGEGDYRRALGALTPEHNVSLYLHIPFCREMCLFCGCHTFITQRDDRVRRYAAVLQREMELAAAAAPCPLNIGHLHFGGGTPNILTPDTLHGLFGTMRRLFDFSSVREIALELDPRTLRPEHIAAMADNGVTRISLGVQDFEPEVQQLVHRIQPYEMVAQVCAWARQAGISRINFDLMYGLPAQTPASVAATAQLALELAPSRIALFSYAHVPRMKPHQKALEKHPLPDAEARLAMEDGARAAFRAAGYAEIGMDHFAHPDDNLARAAREGRLRRNFQGYTDDATDALLGFGASAIGFTPQGYIQNEKDTRAYERRVEAGELPVTRGYLLTPEDRLRAAIIEKLMCDLSCDVDALCRLHGATRDMLASSFERLRPFVAAGLASIDGGTVRLTSPYRMAVRSLAQAFDATTAPDARTYSRVA